MNTFINKMGSFLDLESIVPITILLTNQGYPCTLNPTIKAILAMPVHYINF